MLKQMLSNGQISINHILSQYLEIRVWWIMTC
jgi:hypothetical protein